MREIVILNFDKKHVLIQELTSFFLYAMHGHTSSILQIEKSKHGRTFFPSSFYYIVKVYRVKETQTWNNFLNLSLLV